MSGIIDERLSVIGNEVKTMSFFFFLKKLYFYCLAETNYARNAT
jgi:hypothetical protein